MRVAIVTDLHGNRTAFEAILRDLRDTSPDLIVHGGDLADAGSSPAEIIDRINAFGWPGVYGNTDEMQFDPKSLERFAGDPPRMPELFDAIREMAAWTRDRIGTARVESLRKLPAVFVHEAFALVHATRETAWRGPSRDASNDELDQVFESLPRSLVVYGHIHHPYIRKTAKRTVVNAGSVGMPYDGDCRASYVLIQDGVPSIRRVPYDVEQEIRAAVASGIPRAEWIARTLRSASPQMF